MVLEETVFSIFSKEYIATVGFPIAAFVAVILILAFLIRDCTSRNVQCQNSKDAHITAFFKQSAESQEKHTIATDNLTNELKNMTKELGSISTKIDAYTRIYNRQLDIQMKLQSERYDCITNNKMDDMNKR